MPYRDPEASKANSRKRYARLKADPTKLAETRTLEAERIRLRRSTDPAFRRRQDDAAKIWQRENKERWAETQRRHKLKKAYGLTLEAYEAMLAEQSGACAICRELQPAGTTLHVDHDHATGEVRGLLCSSCNLGLGKFQDDPGLLLAAAAYLRRR